jgi:choline-glycine betaine transporter
VAVARVELVHLACSETHITLFIQAYQAKIPWAVMAALVQLIQSLAHQRITAAAVAVDQIITTKRSQSNEQAKAVWAAAVAVVTAIELLVLQVLPIQVAAAAAVIGKPHPAAQVAPASSSFAT